MKIDGCKIQALIERYCADVQWCSAYGEPGYDTPEHGIIFANWNDVPQVIGDWLEHHGYAIEWSDEWITNDNGDKAYRTSPDSHGWTPYYWINDSCVIGGDEIENGDCADEYLKWLINNPKSANVFRGLDLAQYGFAKLNSEYETGFHPGQTDDPHTVLEKLRETHPDHDVVFEINDVGQFDTHWTAWIRPKESET